MDTSKLLPEKLVCPKCLCPVNAQGGLSSVACPRCNTWLDLDPKCLGSCLSCHKLQQENPSACLDEAVKLETNYNRNNQDAKRDIIEAFYKFLGKYLGRS